MPTSSTPRSPATRAATNALVPVRPRSDGWTAEKQRDFIEHLADTACVKEAAGLVGMSEASAHRLRRRSDAVEFDAAWEAALEMGLDRLASVAIERALKGRVRQIWYHGELVAEEIVHSDRLLLWLLANGRSALGRAKARAKVAADWDGAMGALGREKLPGEPEGGFRIWMSSVGTRVTNFPPPPGFDGYEEKHPGHPRYFRSLTDAEEQAEDARNAAPRAAVEAARRRRFAS